MTCKVSVTGAAASAGKGSSGSKAVSKGMRRMGAGIRKLLFLSYGSLLGAAVCRDSRQPVGIAQRLGGDLVRYSPADSPLGSSRANCLKLLRKRPCPPTVDTVHVSPLAGDLP
ncbi:hypothetical protein GCM10011247_03090 [Pseudomonas plecoglossicida]|nr:hypothetical protein GCM10011247_03090 [Pseudomonas plecoglossicida]